MKTLKNKAKKGFTIVELVIVIAVIAILAAVLIPTFTNVVSSAKESAAMQESRNEWTEYLVEIAADGEYTEETYYVVYDNTYVFVVDSGDFKTDPATSTADEYSTYYNANISSSSIKIQYTYTYSNSKVTIYAPIDTIDGQAESEAAAAAAAAVSAASSASLDASTTYYAKVVIGTTTYWFEGTTTSTATEYVVSEILSAEPSHATTAKNTSTITVNTNYSVDFYAVSN